MSKKQFLIRCGNNQFLLNSSSEFSKQNVTFHRLNPEFFPPPTLILSGLQNPSSYKNVSKDYFL